MPRSLVQTTFSFLAIRPFLVILAVLALVSCLPEPVVRFRVTATDEARLETLIRQALYEGLFCADPATGFAAPGLAESWQSDDFRVFEFTLRSAVWSDGSPVTAAQFVDSWLGQLNPDAPGENAEILADYIRGAREYLEGRVGPDAVGLNAADERRLIITTVSPMPAFPEILIHPAFLLTPVDDTSTLVNGPFMPSETQPEQGMMLLKNRRYWDAEQVRITELVYIAEPDPLAAAAAFESGSTDWVSIGHDPGTRTGGTGSSVKTAVPAGQAIATGAQAPDDLTQVTAGGMPAFASVRDLYAYYYLPNMRRGPTALPPVRKALALALDREALTKELTMSQSGYPIYEVAAGLVPSDALRKMALRNGGVAQADLTGYGAFDPEDARALLTAAGIGDPEKLGVFTILVDDGAFHIAVAEAIKKQWENNLGIRVRVRAEPWDLYWALRRMGEFTLVRAGWLGDSPDPAGFLEPLSSAGSAQDSGYAQEEFDRLLSRASAMPGGAERYETLFRAESRLLDDAALLPLMFRRNLHLIDTSAWIGWHENASDTHLPRYIGPIR